jgi:RNA polymerase sigma-70 factor (ECF subfamily)
MTDPSGTADFERDALPWLNDVARFALSLTRDETEADDLVQMTYLNAFRGWHTFKPGTDVRKWLFTICRNAFLKSLRKQDRLVFSEEGDLDAMPSVMGHIYAERQEMGDLLSRIDVGPAIDRAIRELPEPHRSILTLVDVEGLHYQEAAEVLEVPVGTVRSRLFRARRAVQESLIRHAEDMGLAGGNQEGTDAAS